MRFLGYSLAVAAAGGEEAGSVVEELVQRDRGGGLDGASDVMWPCGQAKATRKKKTIPCARPRHLHSHLHGARPSLSAGVATRLSTNKNQIQIKLDFP